MGKAINELDSAGSITDATLVPVGETDTLKKTTWATVKSTLKTYFDTLYQSASANLTSWAALATSAKQDALVSGTSIKTVNSTTLLGSGDVAVQATLVSGTNIKTINSTSLLGSGDLTVSAAPGGSTTQVQYNSAGAFAGHADFTYDGAGQITVKSVKAQKVNNAPMLTTGTTSSDSMFAWGTGNIVHLLYGNLGNWGELKLQNLIYTGLLQGPSFALTTTNNGLGVLTGGTNWRNVTAGHIFPQGYDSTNYTYDVALGKNAAGVAEINNGTAGTYRDLKLRNLIASGGVVTLASFTVSTLPSASTSGAGAMAYVTDSNATTYRATVAGGGSDKVTVTSDGTNWIITG